MGHRNILTLVDYFETLNNIYLVTELALGGELFDRVCKKGSYFEADAADAIRQVLSGVAYLHENGVVHGNLRPENLLYRTPEDNSDLLIVDTGVGRFFEEDSFVDEMHAEEFSHRAPEKLKHNGPYLPTKEADMWAMGVITYFLLCGYTPFDRDNYLEEMQAILVADYSFTPVEYWRGVSAAARDFINKCLTIDPKKRITAHEALSHPFLTEKPLSRRNTGQPC
jgi:calcium/calmodulin-dependent protein kinase I